MSPGPPQPISQDDIKIVRETDPTSGQIVTRYLNARGEEVLPPTYHLASEGLLDPEPS